MPKPFDAATKHLVELDPRPWLALAGIQAQQVSIRNVDLSTVTAAADHVVQVDDPPDPWLAHFEFQSGRDTRLSRRLLLYNILLSHQSGRPAGPGHHHPAPSRGRRA